MEKFSRIRQSSIAEIDDEITEAAMASISVRASSRMSPYVSGSHPPINSAILNLIHDETH